MQPINISRALAHEKNAAKVQKKKHTRKFCVLFFYFVAIFT